MDSLVRDSAGDDVSKALSEQLTVMATIKQASNDRLRRIEFDCRGELMVADVTPYHTHNTLSLVRHENRRRGAEV